MELNDFLKTAIVVDNNDTDKLGKIKVRVLPEMNGVEESNLPWCRPFILNGGGKEGSGTQNIPEVGEYIKVIIRDKFWQHIEYISGDYIENGYPYSDFSSIVSSMTELGSQTYPQPKFIKTFSDGSFYFHNSSTGESGVYNKNGSYCMFDSAGQIIVHGNNQNIIIDGATSGKITVKNSTATLHTILKDLIGIVKNIITPANLVSASPGSPVVYSQVSTDLPKSIQLDTFIDQLMED
jgi:hypothetical protein